MEEAPVNFNRAPWPQVLFPYSGGRKGTGWAQQRHGGGEATLGEHANHKPMALPAEGSVHQRCNPLALPACRCSMGSGTRTRTTCQPRWWRRCRTSAQGSGRGKSTEESPENGEGSQKEMKGPQGEGRGLMYGDGGHGRAATKVLRGGCVLRCSRSAAGVLIADLIKLVNIMACRILLTARRIQQGEGGNKRGGGMRSRGERPEG